eukprot:3632316-Pleurochrysis_carterae.AAC.2
MMRQAVKLETVLILFFILHGNLACWAADSACIVSSQCVCVTYLTAPIFLCSYCGRKVFSLNCFAVARASSNLELSAGLKFIGI